MSNVFVIIKMCYVHNQWYDISCATLYLTYYSTFFAFFFFQGGDLMNAEFVTGNLFVTSNPVMGISSICT